MSQKLSEGNDGEMTHRPYYVNSGVGSQFLSEQSILTILISGQEPKYHASSPISWFYLSCRCNKYIVGQIVDKLISQHGQTKRTVPRPTEDMYEVKIRETVNLTYEISRKHSIEVKVGCSQLETILTTLP